MLYNSQNISASTLKKALECLNQLTKATADAAAIYRTYQLAVQATGIPLDPQVLSECTQMFTTMNRMMLGQKANIEHVQMMNEVMAESDSVLREMNQMLNQLTA